MQLEQMMYQPMQIQRTLERQRVYTIMDLESLSASALYTGEPCGSFGSLPISDSIREDNHKPYGDHLNYEVWLNLKGKAKGRKLKLSNTHIRVNDD